jgi:hypothetical protein
MSGVAAKATLKVNPAASAVRIFVLACIVSMSLDFGAGAVLGALAASANAKKPILCFQADTNAGNVTVWLTERE